VDSARDAGRGTRRGIPLGQHGACTVARCCDGAERWPPGFCPLPTAWDPQRLRSLSRNQRPLHGEAEGPKYKG